jgi:hypothetical protein
MWLNVVVCYLVVAMHKKEIAITFLISMGSCMNLNVMLCVISAFRFSIINFYWVILVVT